LRWVKRFSTHDHSGGQIAQIEIFAPRVTELRDRFPQN